MNKKINKRHILLALSMTLGILPLASLIASCTANDQATSSLNSNSELVQPENNLPDNSQNTNPNENNSSAENNNSTQQNQGSDNNASDPKPDTVIPNNPPAVEPPINHPNTNSSSQIKPENVVDHDTKNTQIQNYQDLGKLYPTANSYEQLKEITSTKKAFLLPQFKLTIPVYLITPKNYFNFVYMEFDLANKLKKGNFEATSISIKSINQISIQFTNKQKHTETVEVYGFQSVSSNTNTHASNVILRTILDFPSNLDKFGANSLNMKSLFDKYVKVGEDFKNEIEVVYTQQRLKDSQVGQVVNTKDLSITVNLKKYSKELNLTLTGLNQNVHAIPYNSTNAKVIGTTDAGEKLIQPIWPLGDKVFRETLNGYNLSESDGKKAYENLTKYWRLSEIPKEIDGIKVTDTKLKSYGSKDSRYGYFFRKTVETSFVFKCEILLTLENGSEITIYLQQWDITHLNDFYNKDTKKIQFSDSLYPVLKQDKQIYYEEISNDYIKNNIDVFSSDEKTAKDKNFINDIEITNFEKLRSTVNDSIKNYSNFSNVKVEYKYTDSQTKKSQTNSWILRDIPTKNQEQINLEFDMSKAHPVTDTTHGDKMLTEYLYPNRISSSYSNPVFTIKTGYMPMNGTDKYLNTSLNGIDKTNVNKNNLLPLLTENRGGHNRYKEWFHKLSLNYVVKIAELNKAANLGKNTIKYRLGFIDKYDYSKQWYDEWRTVTLNDNELSWYVENQKKINDPDSLTFERVENPDNITIEKLFEHDSNFQNGLTLDRINKYYKIVPYDQSLEFKYIWTDKFIVDHKLGILYVQVNAKDTNYQANNSENYYANHKSVGSTVWYGLQFKPNPNFDTSKTSYLSINIEDALLHSTNNLDLYNTANKTWSHRKHTVQNQTDKLWKLASDKKQIELVQPSTYFNRLNTTSNNSKLSFNIPYVYLTDMHNFYQDVQRNGDIKNETNDFIKYPFKFSIDWNDIKVKLDQNLSYEKDIDLKLSTAKNTVLTNNVNDINYRVFNESIKFTASKTTDNKIKLSIGFKNGKQIFTNYRNINHDNLHGIYISTASDLMAMSYHDNTNKTEVKDLIKFNYDNPLPSEGSAGVPVITNEKFDAKKPFENISKEQITMNVDDNYKLNEGYLPSIQVMNARNDEKGSVFDQAKRRTFMSGGSWTMLSKVKPSDKNDLRFYVITNQHVVSTQGQNPQLIDNFHKKLTIPPLPENNYRNDIGITVPIQHFWLGGWTKDTIENRYGYTNKNGEVLKDGIDAAILIIDLKDVFSYIKTNVADKSVSLALFNYFKDWLKMEPLKVSRLFEQQPPMSKQHVILGGYIQGYPGAEFASQKVNKIEVNRGNTGTMSFSTIADTTMVSPFIFYKGASGSSFITEQNELMGLVSSGQFGGGYKEAGLTSLSTPMYDYIGSPADKLGGEIGSNKLGYSFYQRLMWYILNQPNKYELIDIF